MFFFKKNFFLKKKQVSNGPRGEIYRIYYKPNNPLPSEPGNPIFYNIFGCFVNYIFVFFKKNMEQKDTEWGLVIAGIVFAFIIIGVTVWYFVQKTTLFRKKYNKL